MMGSRRSRRLPAAALLTLALGCASDPPQRFAPKPGEATTEDVIHLPARLTAIESQRTDALGKPLRVPCRDCHSLPIAEERKHDASLLEAFHRGLVVNHGDLGCGACHAAERPDALALAGGETIPMQDAMRLCAQCHGTQYRDYRRSAHGGASGYWDRSRGPRLRNHCVDCHDPHAPSYVGALPAFPPRDRRPLAHESDHR
jgi:hypothetical protein